MEHEVMRKKIKNAAKILRVIAQIILWTAVGAAGLIVIGGILMKVFPDTFAQLLQWSGGSGSVNINLGILHYHVPSRLSLREVVRLYEMVGFAIGISCVMGALFLRQLVGVFREVEKGRPFSTDNAKRFGNMGVIVIVSSVLYRIGQALALNTVVNMAGLNDFSVNFTPNTDMIFVGILLFILAGIFKYGSYLQDEYDATL